MIYKNRFNLNAAKPHSVNLYKTPCPQCYSVAGGLGSEIEKCSFFYFTRPTSLIDFSTRKNMQITWNGQSCFTIKSKTSTGEESVVLINPFDEKQAGIKILKSKANIVLFGNKNSKVDTKKVDDNFFLIDKPGEFEIRGIFINGIADKWIKKGPKQNIFFFLEIEGVKILHLGEISHALDNGSLDKLSGIDVLMIPVGGGDNINTEKAIEIINEIEPRMIIPMNFKIPGLKEKLNPVDKFAKEMGINPKEQTDRLKIDKRNLPQDNTEIIIMSKR